MHGSSPQFLVQNRNFEDVDEFSEFSRGWDLEIRQLDRGRFHGSRRLITCGPIQLSHVSYNRRVEILASPQAGTRTFGIHLSQPARWCRREPSAGDIQAHPGGAEVEVTIPPDYDAYTLTVAEDYFREFNEQMGTPELAKIGRKAEEASCQPWQMKKLYCALGKVIDGLAGSTRLPDYPQLSQEPMHKCLRLLCETLASSQPSRSIPDAGLRSKAVKRAKDYIASYADEPPTIADLCHAAEASERTLHYGFLQEFGVTPKAYIKAYRLNAAMRGLRISDPSAIKVADIANRWGFWHMGQFAADYRAMFDELPSEALRKNRAPATVEVCSTLTSSLAIPPFR